jgi:hypothetical protein
VQFAELGFRDLIKLLEALLRLQAIRDVGVGEIVVDVPAGRERALAPASGASCPHSSR